jgi:Putative MetA-pathway of phenol degradation
MRQALWLTALFAAPTLAGPPYETDDPQPTERGHWEIYAFGAREGAAGDFGGAYGFDLNYGPVDNVQLTATLPMAYANGTGSAVGDIELGVKYRFVHHQKSGVDVAIFPRVILPTAGKGFGTGRASFLLPVWAQKTMGRWAIFGGGGYTINPGPGQRDFALASVAVTRQMSDRLTLGIEASRTGPDAVDARASTSLGLGASLKLNDHLALLASGGPIFEDGTSPTRYRAYAALAITF